MTQIGQRSLDSPIPNCGFLSPRAPPDPRSRRIFSVGRIPVCHCHHISARTTGGARPAGSRPPCGKASRAPPGAPTSKGFRKPDQSRRSVTQNRRSRGAEPRTRPLGLQGKQLLSQRQILRNEVCWGPKHSRQPAEQVSNAHKHGGHPIRSAGKRRRCKSFILRAVTILANDSRRIYRYFPLLAASNLFEPMAGGWIVTVVVRQTCTARLVKPTKRLFISRGRYAQEDQNRTVQPEHILVGEAPDSHP